MRKLWKFALIQLCLAALVATTSSAAFASDTDKKLTERLDSATALINDLLATPDKSVPLWVASKATCVLVVPGFKKGAFLFGGQYGQGVATCRNNHRWSAPAFVQITGASFGLQAGGQSTDLVLVGTSHKSMEDLLHEKVKLGGDAAASAGPVGRNAQASVSGLGSAEFLTYSRSKGLFAGLDLTGDVINQNKNDTAAYYGKDIHYSDILSGSVPVHASARPFVRAVSKLFAEGKAAQ